MVKASEISTVATFDLVSETPASVDLTQRHVRSTSDTGHSWASRPFSTRQPRIWTVAIGNGSRGELARLRELWDLTDGGTLPMTYTPPEGGDDVAVVFADTDLVWRQLSSNTGAFGVSLREFYG